MIYSVYAVNWTEHERGWGQRPDGHTLHRSKELAIQYIKDYWKTMPDDAPDEYSSPDDPKLVEVSHATYIEVMEKGTIWGHVRKNI